MLSSDGVLSVRVFFSSTSLPRIEFETERLNTRTTPVLLCIAYMFWPWNAPKFFVFRLEHIGLRTFAWLFRVRKYNACSDKLYIFAGYYYNMKAFLLCSANIKYERKIYAGISPDKIRLSQDKIRLLHVTHDCDGSSFWLHTRSLMWLSAGEVWRINTKIGEAGADLSWNSVWPLQTAELTIF